MINELTLVLRGTAVGLALALMLAGAGLPRRARLALLPMLACLVAYLVRAAPQLRGSPIEALLPLSVGALLFPVAFWWLVRNAFEDRVDIPWPVWLAAAVLLIAGLVSRPADADAAWVDVAFDGVQKLAAAAFVVAALWRLWQSGSEDLVAGRRALRGWLLAYIGLHGLAVLAVELSLRAGPPPAWLDALNVAAIALALAVSLALMVGYRAAAIETLFGAPSPSPVSDEKPKAAAPPESAADEPSIARLHHLMAVDRLYHDPELSLTTLSQHLGLPEYRLRELINSQLGYRNFPAYVNDHRLREVEQKLADPAFDRRPILTLALEAGFGSIGPFNRAFRERHGMTPSAYRAQRGSTVPAV
ncbi:AraC family transcriptional regulator [Piscinibacter sp.]|uniref:AraC family transcriptional regulator n=1 Tax=Piscinibacter sp. TaxID=1903157 RepID=UPI002CC5FCA4|nr:AraC family transcriptional regulator [Albitalea sp.]HUG22618.1 AraC family transcriptional regulator [Albitalea sp.]